VGICGGALPTMDAAKLELGAGIGGALDWSGVIAGVVILYFSKT